MKPTLVIVESPTKAKTITRFLGKGFSVASSFGHIRDLPKSNMGLDIEGKTFAPKYVVPKEKSETVKKLKALAKKSKDIIFATDEDREGEAISWHLAELLDVPKDKARRMVFHEITKRAIEEALAHPRPIDQKLVDAQQARRILDRLVGYELSPLLWKKVAKGLSAGRVQSVALRLIVEREREIKNFKPEEYWTLDGQFADEEMKKKDMHFVARLHAIDEKKLDNLDIKTQEQMDDILGNLKDAIYRVLSITKKESRRNPPPPFTTSTLQQVANHQLGFSSKQTMRIAQQLYEGVELGAEGSHGLITYMRTDSNNLSDTFLSEAEQTIRKSFGERYTLPQPRRYKTKSKGAQEAHEAIRPADPARSPDSIQAHLSREQYRLYELIWKRAVATQMQAAAVNLATIDVEGKSVTTDKPYMFRATGQTIQFDGWLILYPELFRESLLPDVQEHAPLTCLSLKPEQHFTTPPSRYSDATLVKSLEAYGIGRPSTYAPTIATLEERRYVVRDEKKRFEPTDIALIVIDLLVEHFPNIVDYAFTADMEGALDEIASGAKEWQPIIVAFYEPFHETIVTKTTELSKQALTEEKTDERCVKCDSPMVIKIGRFGKFMACSNYPECKTTKPIGEEATMQQELSGEVCENCGKPLMVKRGRFGMFLGCSGYPECKTIKKIEKKTGVRCNLCTEGEFVERKSKRGKPFYGCNRYPECKNALWSKPTGQMCPTCSSPIVFGAKNTFRCSSKTCDYLVNSEPIANRLFLRNEAIQKSD